MRVQSNIIFTASFLPYVFSRPTFAFSRRDCTAQCAPMQQSIASAGNNLAALCTQTVVGQYESCINCQVAGGTTLQPEGQSIMDSLVQSCKAINKPINGATISGSDSAGTGAQTNQNTAPVQQPPPAAPTQQQTQPPQAPPPATTEPVAAPPPATTPALDSPAPSDAPVDTPVADTPGADSLSDYNLPSTTPIGGAPAAEPSPSIIPAVGSGGTGVSSPNANADGNTNSTGSSSGSIIGGASASTNGAVEQFVLSNAKAMAFVFFVSLGIMV
ncbi:hypothetical protein MIND_00923500 [Mycena indigotica]|uniref:Uncharacterized protein n=1 Tax=Mycena indigotica TaxID=2126181 RepID=A0A8H6SDF9_9AGAR|nr:uncharacterized protein MIND_00923500 [Mycena indigotica]KAF7296917.1 hypothetical protein MIND_00923500 [Mycena indigotica]